MKCPECGIEGFKKTCQECGHTTTKPFSKYPTITGRTDTTIRRDCAYVTGTWKCQWRQWASDHEEAEQVRCDFHQKVMADVTRHGADYGTGKHLWDTFLTEWEFNHHPRFRHRGSWAFRDGAIPEVPFWYQPIQESWRMLTGLPLPEEEKHRWDQFGLEMAAPVPEDSWQEDDPILAGKTDAEKGMLIAEELKRKIRAGERIRPLKGLTFSEWKRPVMRDKPTSWKRV